VKILHPISRPPGYTLSMFLISCSPCNIFSFSFHIIFLNFLISDEQVKQKQTGSERMLLPSVEGHAAGNWIVVDSGV